MSIHSTKYPDDSMLWIGSFRYYIGRMTIQTHAYGAMLVKRWAEVPKDAQSVILRDLKDAIERDSIARESKSDYCELGMEMDAQMWRDVYLKIRGDV